MKRVAVFASGGGSNLQALLDYTDQLGDAPFAVTLVASDRSNAGCFERVAGREISRAHIEKPGDGLSLLQMLRTQKIELLVLAGYLKFVPAQVTEGYHGAILNIHPSLLPKFGGPGMYGKRVHEAVLAAHETESGATVHFVNDAYDRGAPIACATVPVLTDDSAATLAARVLTAEHVLFPRAIHAVAAGFVTLARDGQAKLTGIPGSIENATDIRISFATKPSFQL